MPAGVATAEMESPIDQRAFMAQHDMRFDK
jgi:hypothetical protein